MDIYCAMNRLVWSESTHACQTGLLSGCAAPMPQPSAQACLPWRGGSAGPDWRRWTCHSSSLASIPLSFGSHAERKTTADPVLFQRHVCARNPVRKSVCMRERESLLVGAYEEREGRESKLGMLSLIRLEGTVVFIFQCCHYLVRNWLLCVHLKKPV